MTLEAADARPCFPPLLSGRRVPLEADPFQAAIDGAQAGEDGGVIYWSPRADRFEAAILLAPEGALADALTILFALELSVVDALGALAPPEVGVVWAWPDVLLVNGAEAGRLRAAASTPDPNADAEWLVFALSITLTPLGEEPGERPEVTSLLEEGCGALDPIDLTEVWARHALLWINNWLEGGLPAMAENWRERAFGADLGPDTRLAYPGVDGAVEGGFLGLDERGGLLLKKPEGGVVALALTEALRRGEQPAPDRLRRP